ncbi:amino acid ABC transporter ATP-binding protein [Rhodococcus globerulus]|uniref:amino acid ABC transporter ATP-binding protein n=1 Tax=Rhodococcus globerulus TaxID=33008 RepID=UPI000524A831|nr:amino acid ABC transporter ATP-binding protein [Rhodococcus globerulus]PVX59582.1 polar amino acid transport system ATP-binding protein [Rhodococcus globerulus]
MTSLIDTSLVKARGVQKWYGSNHILKGIDLDVHRGEVVALIGPSGSGKTTFLRCINFLEKYQAGSIEVDGSSVGHVVEGEKTFERGTRDLAAMRSTIGMVFQHFNLFPHMTVAQNIAYGPRVVKKQRRDVSLDHARELLARVGLADKADQMPGSLSGGQQQRVGIARALAMKPKLLLLDEPTSSLDPELVGEVLSVIRDVADQGMTMIIVTHELAFARDVADQVVFMDGGVVVESGPPDQVLGFPSEDRTKAFLHRYL